VKKKVLKIVITFFISYGDENLIMKTGSRIRIRIRIDLKGWIRIRICIEINTDPKH